MASGGDGYPNFFARAASQGIMAQVLEDYVATSAAPAAPLSPVIQGRIKCIDSNPAGGATCTCRFTVGATFRGRTGSILASARRGRATGPPSTIHRRLAPRDAELDRRERLEQERRRRARVVDEGEGARARVHAT